MTPDEYKAQCQCLSDFYAEAAKTGKLMQIFDDVTCVWEDYSSGPCMLSNLTKWRLKPEPVKAWVVWANNWPCVVLSEEAAKNQARTSGGTIQEITRPE